MKCPNCGKENPDGATECAGCQVVFAKWKERGETKAPRPAEEAGKPSPAQKILALLALAALTAWFFLKPAAHRPAAPAAPETPRPAVVVVQAAAQPAAEPAAPTAPQNMWRFEGTVRDLLTGAPVEGATLKFHSDGVVVAYNTGGAGYGGAASGGGTFQAVTDGSGRYSLELRPLEQSGYGLNISRPGYGDRHWEAAEINRPLKERCRLAQGVQFVSDLTPYKAPGAGGPVIYDLALYPNSLEKLNEREKAECQRGISGR